MINIYIWNFLNKEDMSQSLSESESGIYIEIPRVLIYTSKGQLSAVNFPRRKYSQL